MLHIVLNFSDQYMKGKVFSPVVGGAPELLAASYVLCRASAKKKGEELATLKNGRVQIFSEFRGGKFWTLPFLWGGKLWTY